MPHSNGGSMAPMQPIMPAMAGNTEELTQGQGTAADCFGQQQNNHHPSAATAHPMGWNSQYQQRPQGWSSQAFPGWPGPQFPDAQMSPPHLGPQFGTLYALQFPTAPHMGQAQTFNTSA